MEKNQELGLRGEKAFSLACTSAGLICNKSTEDLAGWDFYLQFSLDASFTGSLDHRPSALCAFVQVKTFSRPTKRVGVRLSNAERMVTESRPTFFAIGVESPTDGSICFLLGHIGERAIAFILKKLRETTLERARLSNQVKIYIPLEVLDLEEISHPKDIIKIIKKYSYDSIEKYVREKIRISKTVGYGAQAFRGKFALSGSGTDDRMVALMIGEIDQIEVNDFVVTETRFDIEKVAHSASSAIMRVTPTNEIMGIVTFSDSSKSINSEFNARIRTPSIPNLEAKAFRIRFESDWFAFSVSLLGDVTNWKFNPDWNEHKVWNDLKNDVSLLKLLEIGRCDIAVYVGAERVVSGSLFVNEDLIEPLTTNTEEFQLAIQTIDFLCRSIEVRNLIRFSANEFSHFVKNARSMNFLIGSSGTHRLLLTSNINELPTKDYKVGKMIFPLLFRSDGSIVVLPIVVKGKVVITKMEVKLYVNGISPGACRNYQTKKSCMDFLAKFVDKYCKDQPDDEIIIVHESIERILSSHLLSM